MRVQELSARDGSVVVEDSITLTPLQPSEEFQMARPPENGEMFAPYAPAYGEGIFIDAKLDDWDHLVQEMERDESAIHSILDSSTIATVVHDGGCDVVAEPDLTDLFGDAFFAYDGTFLYAIFLVADDGYYPYFGEDEFIFLGDAPQLLIDVHLNKDFEASQLNDDDIQIDLHPGFEDDFELFSPYAALWSLDTRTARLLDEIVMASRRTEDGYVVEAAIPWKSLGFTPAEGATLGIAASISDNDSPEEDAQQCMISSAPERNFRDPTTWGTLYLLPAP